MDLHRLRVVEFNTIVSDKEHEQAKENKKSSVDKKDEIKNLASKKKCLKDDISPPGSSKRISFIKRKSKSEIFEVPTKNKPPKRELKNNSSFVDLSKLFQDHAHSNQKKRTLKLFNRKSRYDQKECDIKKNKEDITFLFARETPSFIRYSKSKKRGQYERQKQKRNTNPPKDVFGFQKSNRYIDPYLYQMSCNYLNIDKFAFKNFRKGLRHKLNQPMSVKNSSRHHGMRVLNSRVFEDKAESSSIYYNLVSHPHERKYFCRYEDDYDEAPINEPTYDVVKDEIVSVSPSSLCPLTKNYCNACTGPSKTELSLRSNRFPPCTQEAVLEHRNSPCPCNDPVLQHSTPSPSCESSYPAQTKHKKRHCQQKLTVGSIVFGQHKIFSGCFQKITTLYFFNRNSAKNCIKYVFFGILIVVWSPCLLAVLLTWVVMCPVRISNIFSADKSKTSISVMHTLMHKFRKKNQENDVEDKIFENCAPRKNRSFLTLVASWYSRALGTVFKSFDALWSTLKLKTQPPPRVGSSFLPTTHPNPRKRYTLFYEDDRGWMMKPMRRSNTRSCANHRVVQSMRCEHKPTFWPYKARCDQNAQTRISLCKNVSYKCPIQCFAYTRQKSAAGDACPMRSNKIPRDFCGEKSTSYSRQHKARNIKPESSILKPVASRRVQHQQVNMPPIYFLPTSGFSSNSNDYINNSTQPVNSNQVTDILQNKNTEFCLDERKNGTLPFGVVFNCPCGTKKPLITNMEASRSHKLGLAGKTLKTTRKYSPSFIAKGVQEYFTKCGTKLKLGNTSKNIVNTNYTTNLTKNIPPNCVSNRKSNGLPSKSTKCEIALNTLCLETNNHRHEKKSSRNEYISAHTSRSSFSKQAETIINKVYYKDKSLVYCNTESTPQQTECVPNSGSFSLFCRCGLRKKQPARKPRKVNVACQKKTKTSGVTTVSQESLKHKLRRIYDSSSSCVNKIRNLCKLPINATRATESFIKQQLGIKPQKEMKDCACTTEPQVNKAVATHIRNERSTQKTTSAVSTTMQTEKKTINCSCGAENTTREIQCTCNSSESTLQARKKTSDCACTTEKKREKNSVDQPVKEEATQCCCKSSDSSLRGPVKTQKLKPPKKTSDCACTTEKGKKTVAADQPVKEKATQCACKSSESSSKGPVKSQKLKPRKKTSDCACTTEKKKKTVAADQPVKEEATQCCCKSSESSLKGPVKTQNLKPPKKTSDCACTTEKKIKTIAADKPAKEKATQCSCKTSESSSKCPVKLETLISRKKSPEKKLKTVSTHTSAREKATQCTCKSSESASKGPVKLQKQIKTVSTHKPAKEKSTQCVCKSSESSFKCPVQLQKLISRKKSSENKIKTVSKHKPAKEKATQCVCKSSESSFKCPVQLQKLISRKKSSEKKIKTVSKHKPAKEKATQCACKSIESSVKCPSILQKLISRKKKIVSEEATQCTCKLSKTSAKEPVKSQKSKPLKKTSKCSCLVPKAKEKAIQCIIKKVAECLAKETTQHDILAATSQESRINVSFQSKGICSKNKDPCFVGDNQKPSRTSIALGCPCNTDNELSRKLSKRRRKAKFCAHNTILTPNFPVSARDFNSKLKYQPNTFIRQSFNNAFLANGTKTDYLLNKEAQIHSHPLTKIDRETLYEISSSKKSPSKMKSPSSLQIIEIMPTAIVPLSSDLNVEVSSQESISFIGLHKTAADSNIYKNIAVGSSQTISSSLQTISLESYNSQMQKESYGISICPCPSEEEIFNRHLTAREHMKSSKMQTKGQNRPPEKFTHSQADPKLKIATASDCACQTDSYLFPNKMQIPQTETPGSKYIPITQGTTTVDSKTGLASHLPIPLRIKNALNPKPKLTTASDCTCQTDSYLFPTEKQIPQTETMGSKFFPTTESTTTADSKMGLSCHLPLPSVIKKAFNSKLKSATTSDCACQTDSYLFDTEMQIPQTETMGSKFLPTTESTTTADSKMGLGNLPLPSVIKKGFNSKLKSATTSDCACQTDPCLFDTEMQIPQTKSSGSKLIPTTESTTTSDSKLGLSSQLPLPSVIKKSFNSKLKSATTSDCACQTDSYLFDTEMKIPQTQGTTTVDSKTGLASRLPMPWVTKKQRTTVEKAADPIHPKRVKGSKTVEKAEDPIRSIVPKSGAPKEKASDPLWFDERPLKERRKKQNELTSRAKAPQIKDISLHTDADEIQRTGIKRSRTNETGPIGFDEELLREQKNTRYKQTDRPKAQQAKNISLPTDAEEIPYGCKRPQCPNKMMQTKSWGYRIKWTSLFKREPKAEEDTKMQKTSNLIKDNSLIHRECNCSVKRSHGPQSRTLESSVHESPCAYKTIDEISDIWPYQISHPPECNCSIIPKSPAKKSEVSTRTSRFLRKFRINWFNRQKNQQQQQKNNKRKKLCHESFTHSSSRPVVVPSKPILEQVDMSNRNRYKISQHPSNISSRSRCCCPVDEVSSTHKNIFSRHRRISKAPAQYNTPRYSSHQTHSRCYCPIPKSSSKIYSYKSHSSLSGRSISRQSKQSLLFNSKKCCSNIGNTSTLQHSLNSLNKCEPRRSQSDVKYQYNYPQKIGVSHHSSKTVLERQSNTRQQNIPSKTHKTSQFPSRFSRSKKLNSSHSNLKQHKIQSQHPSTLDKFQPTSMATKKISQQISSENTLHYDRSQEFIMSNCSSKFSKILIKSHENDQENQSYPINVQTASPSISGKCNSLCEKQQQLSKKNKKYSSKLNTPLREFSHLATQTTPSPSEKFHQPLSHSFRKTYRARGQSKYLKKAPTPTSLEQQKLCDKPILSLPLKTSIGTEGPTDDSCFSQQLKISNQSRHYASQTNPKDQMLSDPVSCLSRNITTGPETQQRKAGVSVHPHHCGSQTKPYPMSHKERENTGIKIPFECFPDNIIPYDEREKATAVQRYPSKHYIITPPPYPPDATHPIIPIIPGMCRCAAKQRFEAKSSGKTTFSKLQNVNCLTHLNFFPISISENQQQLKTNELVQSESSMLRPSYQRIVPKYSTLLSSQQTQSRLSRKSPVYTQRRYISDPIPYSPPVTSQLSPSSFEQQLTSSALPQFLHRVTEEYDTQSANSQTVTRIYSDINKNSRLEAQNNLERKVVCKLTSKSSPQPPDIYHHNLVDLQKTNQPTNASNFSDKIGLVKKLRGISQHIIIQRSEVNQIPQNASKSAPVDKPLPGLLQQNSSGYGRKSFAGGGVQQYSMSTKHQMPCPDFNRVALRYKDAPPCNRSGPRAKQSVHISTPATSVAPSAAGATPPPKYARYPCFINPANKCGPKTCNDEIALRRAYKRRPLRYTPTPPPLPKPRQKCKKAPQVKHTKVPAGCGCKICNFFKCFRDMIRRTEKQAWPHEITCRPLWIHALKHKPCFWIYELWPSLYPAFLTFHKFQQNIGQMCMYVMSICFWCPLLFCVYFCVDIVCRC